MTERRCACGCGSDVVGRSNARYASDACRSRDWKRRAGYVDPRAAKPRRNVSKCPSRPTSPRLSYRKTLDAVTSFLVDQYALRGGAEEQDVPPSLRDHCRVTAEAILEPLLPPAARKALS